MKFELLKFLHRHLALHESLDGNILGAFRELADNGRLELITSAATHGGHWAPVNNSMTTTRSLAPGRKTSRD
jgi:hypothetical protein